MSMSLNHNTIEEDIKLPKEPLLNPTCEQMEASENKCQIVSNDQMNITNDKNETNAIDFENHVPTVPENTLDESTTISEGKSIRSKRIANQESTGMTILVSDEKGTHSNSIADMDHVQNQPEKNPDKGTENSPKTKNIKTNLWLPSLLQGWSKEAVGQRLESYPIQLLTTTLLYLDVLSCTMITILLLIRTFAAFTKNDARSSSSSTNHPNRTPDPIMSHPDPVNTMASHWLWSLYLQLLQSFTGFTLVYFVLEMCLVLYAFGFPKVVRHFGYRIDLIILFMFGIGAASRIMIQGGNSNPFLHSSQMIHSSMMYLLCHCQVERLLLSFFRVWRVFRLVVITLEESTKSNEQIQEELNWSQEKLKECEDCMLKLDDWMEEERKKKMDLEVLVQSSLEEIDTLNAALNLAALDILQKSQETKMTSRIHTNEFSEVQPVVTETWMNLTPTIDTTWSQDGTLNPTLEEKDRSMEVNHDIEILHNDRGEEERVQE